MPETHIPDLSRLKRRLILLYLIAAAGFIAGGLAYRHNYRSSLEKNAETLLQSTEDFKLDQLAYWHRDKIADTEALVNSPLYVSYLKRFAANTSNRGLLPILKNRLVFFVANYGYLSAAITDAKGRIFLTAGGEFKLVSPESVQLIASAKAEGQPVIGEFNTAPGEKFQHITMVAQATKSSAGKELFLVVRISPEKYIYPLVQKWPTKTRTGETLIARRKGDEVVFLSERRFNPALPRLKISSATARLPAAMGLSGITGIVHGLDYRGVEVVASINAIPNTSWVMVTKMDRDEVMENSGRISALLILLTLALLAAAGAMAFLLFRLQADEYLREYLALDRQARKLKLNYDFLAENANDGIFVVDAATLRIKESNKKCREFYGYTAAELSALRITDLVPESDIDPQKKRLEHSRGHAGAVLEAVHRRKNGELFPVEVSSSFVSAGDANYLFTIIRDISERKKAQERIEQSETRLRMAAAGAEFGIYAYDFVTGEAYYSPEFLALYDLQPGAALELDSDLAPKALHPDDREVFVSAMRAANAPGSDGALDLEYRISLPAGKTRWLRVRGRTAFTGSGAEARPLCANGIIQDITRRKQAEETLLRSEEKLRTLINAMPDIVCFKDGKGRWLEANSFDLHLFGLEGVDYKGRKDSELAPFSPFYRDAFMACEGSDEAAWRKGSISRGEEIIPTPSGKNFVFDIIKVPLFNPDGGRLGLIVVGRDITKRKKTEDALLASETMLREAQNIGHMGSYLLDIPTGKWSASKELLRIFGIGAEYDRTVKGWEQLVHPADRAMMTAYLTDEVIGQGKPFNKEYRIIRKNDGAERWVHGLGRLEFGAEGRPGKMHGTIHDITENKITETRLEKLNRDLIDKKQEMENFLYITTHDLRSPLVNIQGFSQNLERYVKELGETLVQVRLRPEEKTDLDKLLADRIPGALKFVLDSSHKMDTLITALLKVSRIGRVEMKPETVDMNELLKKILNYLRYQLEDSGGKVAVTDLPPCHADPGAVSQLFSNLLDNAIKYRHPERALTVNVTGEVKDGMAHYKVTDNGAGIPEPDLGRIWNVFYQQDKAAGKKGEGIGLPMVRRIAEKNGGGIRVESKEGEGSVFYVELPAAQGEET